MNRKIKVLFTSPNLKPGGSQKQLVNILNGLDRKLFDLSIFLTYKEGEFINQLSPDIKLITSPKINVLKALNFINHFFYIIYFIKVVYMIKPQILYSRHRTKIINAFVGKLFKIATVNGEGNNIYHTLIKKNRRFTYTIRKLTAKFSTITIANSQSLADELKETFSLRDNVKVIYNGVDINGINIKSKENLEHRWFNEDIPVLVSVGRLEEQKGFKTLIQAVKEVNKSKEIRLIIIGDGKLKSQLIDYTKHLGLENNIDFIGVTINPYCYMARCDLFVCSSVYEGLANVLLEAITLGKPVISTNHKHGASEIIKDGVSGILIPVEDSKSLAEAILRVLKDKKLNSKLRNESRKSSEKFSNDVMISNYEKLFSNILH